MLPISHVFSHSIVGLDIHADEIRLLHLKKKRQKICIENFAFVPLTTDAIQDGKIKQIEVIYLAIKKLVEMTNTKNCRAIIALPGVSVIMKKILLPASIRESEQAHEIKSKLNHYLPGMSEELCFDFVKTNSTAQNENEVLLVASRSEQLNMYLTVTNEAGLKTRVVDVDSFALLRAVFFSLQKKIASAAVILDVGISGTQFLIFKNQEIIFKQHLGVVLEEFLIIQIKRAIQVCLSTYSHLQLDTVYLTNGFHLISQKMQNELGLKIVFINPFPFLDTAPAVNKESLSNLGSRFLVSLGLAMRSVCI